MSLTPRSVSSADGSVFTGTNEPDGEEDATADFGQLIQRAFFADLEHNLMETHNFHRRLAESRRRRLRSFPKLPAPIRPLEDGHLRYELEHGISDGGFRRLHECIARSIAQKNNMEVPLPETAEETEETASLQPNQPSFTSMLKHYLSSSIFGSSPDTTTPVPKRPASQWNTVDLIFGREVGLGKTNHWTLSQKRGALCPSQLPASQTRVIDRKPGNAYTGTFSDDGELFVAGFQDQRILVYKPEMDWTIQKHITARMLRWTITDTCLSHDNGYLLYSTISPVIHIVKLHGEDSVVDSQANITEIHAPVNIGEDDHEMFGIWSMAWSKDLQEIVVGTNGDEGNIKLYSMEQQYTTASIPGHLLDVNAVAFMDDSSQVFVSGSDDADIKLWDRRICGHNTNSSSGVLVGHLEGITHIDAKGDGRYLISNSKDQTIKLWDIRKMVSDQTADSHRQLKNSTMPHLDWDYRWNDYPAREYLLEHPRDASLMTFRGHCVLQTLIRAYFSPSFTTGQRYIYSGCRNGTVRIFDILSGETVQTLDWHRTVVRDCAWHPFEPLLVSTSWDGHLVEWTPARST